MSEQRRISSAYLCNDFSRMVRVSDHPLPRDEYRLPWSGREIIIGPNTTPKKAIAKLQQITAEIENL